MVTRLHLRPRVRAALSFVVAALLPACLAPPGLQAQQRQVLARTINAIDSSSKAVDAGPLPVSEPMHLTVRLAATPDRQAALDQLLTEQTTPTSSSYHRWLTPQQFAAKYGATDEQISATTVWLQSQGLTVDGVSTAKTRIAVSGTADQVQRAFAVTLRNYAVSGTQHYASTVRPSIPQEVSSAISEVSGLDDMPAPMKTRVAAIATNGLTTVLSTDAADPLAAVAAAVDGNSAAMLMLKVSDCTASVTQADYEAYRALFRQAAAQGITVVTSNACDAQDDRAQFSDLSETTALITRPVASPLAAIDPRPGWQSAPGLPADGLRHTPDLTTSSVEDFTQTMASILQQTDGGRQGNINATLYELASTPDLYTQPDGATGTWESGTGLGAVNLRTLAKVFPRATGSISTSTSLTADQYTVGYGTPIKLSATITPTTNASQPPSGTITFSSSQGTIGSAQLSNDTATFTTSSLNVGRYSVTANYSGDSNYAPSTSSAVVITVNLVNATLVATISPAQNVPYGATATVTATVKLPTSSAAPSGTVTATIQAVTGSVFDGTLSPNPGGNTATSNIVINAPKPQTQPYTVEVTCAGNQNFQCQSPVDLTFTTAKGNTLTTISLTPQSPQAGEPVTLTAIVNNAGNATGTFSFSGNIAFYDNGALIATVPVATNGATTSKTFSGNVQHSIVAKYSGDANWLASNSAPQSVQPTLLPSTLTLTSNATTTLAGVNLVLTATVFTTATNSVGPTGSVTFYDTFNGSVVQLGTPTTLTPNGPNQSIAIFSTTGLLAGTHSVYAIYGGDANFNTATSSTLSLTLADYNLTGVPQTLTLKAGQTGKVVMLLGMVGGFKGTVNFGCSPPSNAEATCSFSPASLTGGGSTTLQIATTAATTTTPATTQKAALDSRWNIFGGTALAALFCFVAPRRRVRARLGLVLAAFCLSANFGCGSGKQASDPVVRDPGTPLGTQIFTITTAGSDGANTVRHTYQYQVTIQ